MKPTNYHLFDFLGLCIPICQETNHYGKHTNPPLSMKKNGEYLYKRTLF